MNFTYPGATEILKVHYPCTKGLSGLWGSLEQSENTMDFYAYFVAASGKLGEAEMNRTITTLELTF